MSTEFIRAINDPYEKPKPGTPERQDFELKFEKKKKVEVRGREVEYIDISPPSGIKPVLTVFFAPGWSEEAKQMKEALFIAVNKGYRVVTLDHARKDAKRKDVSKDEPTEQARVELLKAVAIVTVIEDATRGEKNPEIGMFTHSEGTINGTIAATILHKTEKAKVIGIFSDSPAGSNGKINPLRLVARGAKQLKQGRSLALHSLKDFMLIRNLMTGTLRYLVRNLPLGLDEVIAIARTDISPLQRELARQGVTIVFSHGFDDLLIPFQEVQDHVVFRGGQKEKKLKEKDHNAEGFIHGYLCYPGHHLSLNTEPVKVITLMDATFRQILDNKIPKNALRAQSDPLLKAREKSKKRKVSL